MSELSKWGAALPEQRPSRAAKKAKDGLVEATKHEGLKVDAEAALTGRIMERVVDIDNYRRALASNDEVLHSLLTRVELNFVSKCERIQRSFGSEFPL